MGICMYIKSITNTTYNKILQCTYKGTVLRINLVRGRIRFENDYILYVFDFTCL